MKKTFIGFIVSVLLMLIVGIVMLFSTGAFAQDAHGDPDFFVRRQAMWLAIGSVACMVTACIDYQVWKRAWLPLFGVAVVLLISVFAFPKINGAHRWIKVAGISFQPSEIGKLAAVIFLAAWFENHYKRSQEFFYGFAFPLAIVGILMGLIAIEVDLGTTSLIGATALLTMYVARVRKRYLISLAAGGFSAIAIAAHLIPQRLSRLTAFTDLEKYRDGAGYQQIQGLIALGSGGLTGLGLGNGRQKMLFLPFAHTDFIFPMIGEELGLLATLGVVLCYIVMIGTGFCIASSAKDRFGLYLGFSLIAMLAIQAAINIGVTIALLPNKGIALPFISYGGSSLVFSLIGVGILINIYRQGENESSERKVTRLPAASTPRL